MNASILCEICEHELATVDTNKLSLPLTGAMFDPPAEGYPPPFPAEVGWEFMRCPMCHKRPFISEGEFLTRERVKLVLIDGEWSLPKDNKPVYAPMEGEEYEAAWRGYANTQDLTCPTREKADAQTLQDITAQIHKAETRMREVATEGVLYGLSPDAGVPSAGQTIDAQIIALHNQGKKPGEIGKTLGLHHMAVRNKLRAMGGK